MRIRGRRHLPAGGRANDEAYLEEKGLDHLRERLSLVIDGGRDGFEPHGTATVLLDDGGEEAAIEPIESHGVHALAVEGVDRRGRRDYAVALDLDVVANPPQEPVRDARRSARALGDGPRPPHLRRVPPGSKRSARRCR